MARLRESPGDVAAYERLKAHYLARGDRLAAADLVEGWAARRIDRIEASQAYVEAAQCLADLPREAARCIDLLELALTLHPGHVLAGELLARRLAADPQAWIRSLERRRDTLVRASRPEAEVAELEYQLGEAWAAQGNAERAAHHLRAAYELVPTHLPALRAARRLALEAGRLEAVAELLEREARAEEDRDVKIALYEELRALRERELRDLPGAIDAARAMLALAPEGPRSDELRFWLSDALHVEGRVAEAMRVLAPFVEHGDEKACRRLVELSEGRPDADFALRVLALETLAALYESGGRLEAAVAALEKLSKSLVTREEKAPVAAQLATLLVEKIGDRARGERALRVWAEIAPDDRRPLHALAALLEGAGPSEALLDVLRTLAADPVEGPRYERRALEVARALGMGPAEEVDPSEVEELVEPDDVEELVEPDEVEELVDADEVEELVEPDEVEELEDDAPPRRAR